MTTMKERGIDAAAAFLERVGMTVLDRQVKVAGGTIPLVTVDGDELVYVDVVTKTSASFHHDAEPLDTVTPAMRRRMRSYMDERQLVGNVRYDRVNIRVIAEDRALLRHFRGMTS